MERLKIDMEDQEEFRTVMQLLLEQELDNINIKVTTTIKLEERVK